MIIRSDDRQALSRSLVEIAGMGRFEFNNALLSSCDSLLVRLRDRILSSDCCVYVLIHHICRRLDLDEGNYASFNPPSFNLSRLLTTENAMSTFLRDHKIVFKIISGAIVPFNMSRTLSRGKIGPGPNDMGSGPLPISTRPRRPRRVFPTLVFAV